MRSSQDPPTSIGRGMLTVGVKLKQALQPRLRILPSQRIQSHFRQCRQAVRIVGIQLKRPDVHLLGGDTKPFSASVDPKSCQARAPSGAASRIAKRICSASCSLLLE